MAEVVKGLAGVVVAESKISKVLGEEGRLIYRGYDIHDLAKHATFEEVAHLLWTGSLPDAKELEAFRKDLADFRTLPDELVELITGPLAEASPMAALRTGVSALSAFGPEPAPTPEGTLAAGAGILAKTPMIVAAHHRAQQGEDPVAPPKDETFAGAFLHALNGEAPTPEARDTMDMALVLHADHGFNASTFSARVTASTLSDVYSAVTSAIGTLKGGLHGGANTNVMKLLEKIDGAGSDPVEHVQGMLERKEKVPGFGHRVYRTMDPRAVHLKEKSQNLGQETGEPKWYEMTAAIQEHIHEAKGLWPNVDLYSASVYRSLGIDKGYYTPIFAISRMSGWLAHVAEQLEDNKLIRPRAEYVGPMDLDWVPIDQR
ncbi:MAG: citrate/2-methylcitrate synthase [Candidatus Thermoplasmatota archaeon]|nr:citrate/2-methylcitrate synthase [Candidatus Thermoplasmatota archaeon]